MTTEVTNLANSKTETFFERHAWKVLLGVSLVIGIFGIGDVINGAADLQTGETVMMHSITGTSWNELKATSPKVANLIDLKFRTEGAALTTIALLGSIVCLIGFRRGERWAWYALWVFPLWWVLDVFIFLSVDKEPGSGTPIPVISGSIFLVLWVTLLALSSRKFFRS